jgi:hypothetical protein
MERINRTPQLIKKLAHVCLVSLMVLGPRVNGEDAAKCPDSASAGPVTATKATSSWRIASPKGQVTLVVTQRDKSAGQASGLYGRVECNGKVALAEVALVDEGSGLICRNTAVGFVQ